MNSNAKLNVIAALDLTPIKVKLMHKESGEGWLLEQVNAVEFEYRRFLCLIKLFPNEQVAPRFDVDIFWHYHILDTMKYAIDCNHIFGYFLHHNPYSGLHGGNHEQVRHMAGTRTQELYEATFGEAYMPLKAIHPLTAFADSGAQNDRYYWAGQMTESVNFAFCETVAQNVRDYSAFPTQGMAKTAFCETVAQNDKSYSVRRPGLGLQKTSFCETVAQNDRVHFSSPALATLKTAFCETVAQNNQVYSARLTPASRVFCETVAQNGSVYMERQVLAHAA